LTKAGIDKSSITGFVLAIGGLLGGLLLEGGNIRQIMQPTAAMIVLGGTLGAVMISFPLDVVLASLRRVGSIFVGSVPDFQEAVDNLVRLANKARRDGIVSLDKELGTLTNPFLQRTLMLAVDGTEPQELRKMMELEIDLQSERDEEIPRVFESAGGFSPTVGIIGAVLGLIQVMQHLDNIEEVGRGIAVAFVATIYGVAFANLFCLPAAAKLKIRQRQESLMQELMLEGVISILEGLNPRLLELKLAGFLSKSASSPAKKSPKAVPARVKPFRTPALKATSHDETKKTLTTR
jgi:chemotaxis protein MotA